jgi:hypothetical protein
VGPLTAIVWIALTAGRPQAAAVNWTATVPLWTSLSPTGKVIGASAGPNWSSPPPAARLGALPPMPPEVDAAPGPRELPALESGPILPRGTPSARLPVSPPNPVPRRLVPEPVSLPLAFQATQPRPRRQPIPPGVERFIIPTGGMADRMPAARLGAPSR